MTKITKEELEQIVELANSVPDEYRQKAFEILLDKATSPSSSPSSVPLPTQAEVVPTDKPKKPFLIPIDVKAFLTQYGLDESRLWKFFLIEGTEIRHLYQLKVTKKATAQVQHTLLIALENAISTGRFEAEVEAVRTRCQEYKCYDSANFTKNFQRNAQYFKAIENDQPLSLSPDGKSELADLLETLNG